MSNYFEDEILSGAYDGRLLRRFLGYLKPHRTLVVALLVVLLLGVAGQVVSPLILRTTIDGPMAKADWSGLVFCAGLFLAAIVGASALEYVHGYMASLIGQRIIMDLRVQIFAQLQRLPLSFFDKNPVGRLIVRVTSDIENLSELFTSGLVEVFANLLTLVGLLVMMLVLSWKLTGVTLIASPLVIVAMLAFRKYARVKYRETRRKIALLSAYLSECVQGIRVVKLFGREGSCGSRFSQLCGEHADEIVGAVWLYSLFYPFTEFIGSFCLSALVWYAGRSSLEGSLTFGSFMAFWYCASRLFEPIRELADRYNVLQAAMASAERLFKILDTPQERAGGTVTEVTGGIEFRNVTFSYDGQTKVLDDVSFAVRPGEKIAILGFTGAGKTTMIHLLTRMYDVTQGQILIDGRDIREYDLRALRRAFGVVSQDVFLFAGTIEDNIRLGTPSSAERIDECLRLTSLDQILKKFARGVQTDVRERGLAISAGERQLITFARALHYAPKVVVLDEATSYVDVDTEHRVQESLARLIEGKTAIVIAHRLATVRKVDRILVLHKGRIVEEGTHRELIRKDGIYTKLCKIQFQEAVSC